MAFQTAPIGSHTVTLTLDPPLPSPTVRDYGAAAESLIKILKRYPKEKWTDLLSTKLIASGEDVIRLAEANRKAEISKMKAIAQACLEKLKKTLVNPLTKTPLQTPVLEREWTWEDWMHEDCRRLFSALRIEESPLDDKPMDPHPALHPLAKEMIDWLNSLITLGIYVPRNESPDDAHEGQQALVLSDSPCARCIQYQNLGRAAVKKRTRKEMRSLTVFIRRSTAQIPEFRDLALAQKAAHRTARREQREALFQAFQKALAEKDAYNDSMKALYQENIAALEAKLKATDQTNTAVIETILKEIEAMKQQRLADQSEHERHTDSITQQFRQQLSDLENQNQTTAHIFQEAFTTQGETHQKVLSGLQTQVTELEHLHQQDVAHNAQNEQAIQSLQGSVTQLRNTVAQKDGEIRWLRDHQDDGPCRIM
jgi:hypothetical protein